MRPALRGPAQSEQGTEPTPARSTKGGAGHQLAGAEPLAPSLYPTPGATAPAQQSHGGDRAGVVRFYLGALTHPVLLPSHFSLKRWFEGNRLTKPERRALSANTIDKSQAGAALRWQVTVANPRCLVALRPRSNS